MWRIKAKFATVCPLCRGFIKVGAWIAQPEGGTQWAHAVCPSAVAKPPQRIEPDTYEMLVPVYDDEGNHIGMRKVETETEE